MIVVGSARSGGATTLALALAAHLDAVLVEADPAGGVLAIRHGLGREPGLATLAGTRPPVDVSDHAQRLPSGVAAVVAPESPERAGQVLQMAGQRLASVLADYAARPVVVDAGRLLAGSPGMALARAATACLLVARPSAEHLVPAAELIGSLAPNGHLVLVGTGPYRAHEVVRQLGCGVLAAVPDDPRSARALAEGATAAPRSPLARAVASLAAELLEPAVTPTARRLLRARA